MTDLKAAGRSTVSRSQKQEKRTQKGVPGARKLIESLHSDARLGLRERPPARAGEHGRMRGGAEGQMRVEPGVKIYNCSRGAIIFRISPLNQAWMLQTAALRGINMSRQRIKTTWKIPNEDASLRKFARYLRDKGIRPSTLDSYVFRVGRYLKFCDKELPSQETGQRFRDQLMDNGLSRSSINNYCFAIRQFHRMQGLDFEFTFLKPHNEIPYYFTTEDVNMIFDEIHNIKHLAIFKIAFFACRRASEICNLDMKDLDLDRLTIRVVEGKGGKNAVLYLSEDAASALRDYLAARPDQKIDGRSPLFFSDFGARLDRRDIHRLVINYKKRAGINKPGGAHVLFRHTTASIMVQNGCDLLAIQHVLRHNDIKITMRYLHLADDTRRTKYDQFLKL